MRLENLARLRDHRGTAARNPGDVLEEDQRRRLIPGRAEQEQRAQQELVHPLVLRLGRASFRQQPGEPLARWRGEHHVGCGRAPRRAQGGGFEVVQVSAQRGRADQALEVFAGKPVDVDSADVHESRLDVAEASGGGRSAERAAPDAAEQVADGEPHGRAPLRDPGHASEPGWEARSCFAYRVCARISPRAFA
jgi:hypothetical protein